MPTSLSPPCQFFGAIEIGWCFELEDLDKSNLITHWRRSYGVSFNDLAPRSHAALSSKYERCPWGDRAKKRTCGPT